jgi:hypothetical protein
MARKKLVRGYHDLKDGSREETVFFFLEHLLKARIALNLQTGLHEYDQETNVYIAFLLMSLLTTDAFVRVKPYISAYDADVRRYLENHPGLRNEYRVYKDNADYGLLAETVFLGYDHAGSYYGRVLSERDHGAHISLYYEQAASALAHLACANVTLVHVLSSIASNFEEIMLLVRKVAGDYFDFIERISKGELYHLQREVAKLAGKSEYDRVLDAFLEAYYEYTNEPSEVRRRKVLGLVAALKTLNENFNFDEGKLDR